VDYAGLKIVEALPLSRFAPEGGEGLFRRLRGATIVRIGSTSEAGIEGGGLIIDYKAAGDDAEHRFVLAFNESGMWVVFDTQDEGPSIRA
jgi:hypothetical protein